MGFLSIFILKPDAQTINGISAMHWKHLEKGMPNKSELWH